jgi:anoctamin-7
VRDFHTLYINILIDYLKPYLILIVIIYRIIITSMHSLASLIATSSGAFLNLILIMIVGRVYEKLAYRLTEWGIS